MPTAFGFGIEIEAVVEPWKVRPHWNNKPQEYYERLALALRNRHLKAVADRLDSNWQAHHPEHYDKWFITRDGSLTGVGNQGRPNILISSAARRITYSSLSRSSLSSFESWNEESRGRDSTILGSNEKGFQSQTKLQLFQVWQSCTCCTTRKEIQTRPAEICGVCSGYPGASGP